MKFMIRENVLRQLRKAFAFPCILILIPNLLNAQWSKNATENDTVVVRSGNQTQPLVISDGAGGAIIVWQDDESGNADIYARRMQASGKLSLDFNEEIAKLEGSQNSPAMVATGTGEAFVTWQDDRKSIGSNFEIYAQKIDILLGKGQWTPNGILVQTGNNYILPNIIRDSIFGAIVASYTFRDGNHLIFLQKLDANNGALQWPQFTRLNDNQKAPQPLGRPALISNENRGVIVVWADQREPGALKVYAERLDGSGQSVWPTKEVQVGASLTSSTEPAIIPDGSGGVIIAWISPQEQSSNDQINVQRLNAQGQPQWGNFGRPISTTAGTKENVKIVQVNQDTSLVLWVDLSSGRDRDLRVQRINSSGADIEPEFNIINANGDQVKPALIPDKRDGVIVAWEDNRNNQTDIYAQLIEPSGNLRWGPNGVAVSTATNAQKNPVLIDDKLGGAIIIWEDRRSGTNVDIYAQKVSAPGVLGEFRNITLVEPDTNVVNWEIGSTQMIKWTFRGEIDSVAIELSRDGGQTYREEDIISRTTSVVDGFAMWKVKGPASNVAKIRISAVNADFISDESTQTFTISDSIGPTLTLADTMSVSSFGDSIVVTTSAQDFSGVKMVYLNYRQGGYSSFESQQMATISNNRYRKAIPADFVKEQGVEYFISSVDSIGVFSTTDTFFINVSFGSGVQTSQIVRGSSQNAYRMISAPNILDQTLADSIFAASGFSAYDTTSWRLFDYRNNEYFERDSLNANTFVFTPGSAYWLISAKDRTIDFGTGHSLRVDSPDTITLDPGWNQISVPFAFAVEWDLILSESDNPTVTKPFLYTGSYVTVNSIEPYKGYFVFNQENQNINLLIPAVAFEPNKNVASKGTFLAEAEWEIQINSLCQQARDDFNVVGIHEQALQQWDALDYPEPPPIGKYISVYFPRKEWRMHPNNYTTDYRNAVGQGQTWSFSVKTNIPNSEAKLTFSGVESLPPDLEIWLLDENLNITKNLKRENSYTFPTGHFGTIKTLKLLVGRNDYLAGETSDIDLIPKDFELSQNFPNPFNPITSIRYALPRTAHVHLQVFDLLGKEVTTLLDHELKEAGFHLITWNGKDKHGKSVASGLYIYRLVADEYAQTRKMLLVK